jgi:predicted nucleic acid-binding protein
MRYLLDTTVLIDHAHGRAGVAELLDELFGQPHDLFSCDVIVTEALSRGTDEEILVIGSLILALEYVSTYPEAARCAGESRRTRSATGPRSISDAVIASVARSLDAIVVTRNPHDFERQSVPVLAYGPGSSE